MDINELYEFIELSGHSTAFNKEQVIALYAYASTLDRGSNIVEIGVEYGRSATVLGFAALERGLNFTAVDGWVQDNSGEARKNVESVLIEKLKLPITLVSKNSADASVNYTEPISLIHIDGDHEYGGVVADIKAWTPKVVRGGFVVFDDYGNDSLPAVYRACNEYMTEDKYDFLGRYGSKLGVYRRL